MFKLLNLSFEKKDWLYLILNTIFCLLQIAGYIAIPILLGYLNQLGDSNNSYNNSLFPSLNSNTQATILLVLLLCLSVISFIFGTISIYFSSKLAAHLANNLRIRIFNKSINFSKEDWKIWSKTQIGNLITVDLTYISNSFEFIFRIVYRTIFLYIGSILGILIISFSNDFENVINYPNLPTWSIAVMTITISIVMFAIIVFFSYFASKKFEKNQKILDYVNEFVEHDIYAQKTIKLLNLQEYQAKKFKNLNLGMKKIYTKTGIIQSAILPTIYFFLDISIVLATWLTPKSMIAQLSSYLLFIGLILNSMVSCSLAIININKGISCSRRVLKFLNYKLIIKFPKHDIQINNCIININNLTYNYNLNFKLNVDKFTLMPGQKIGLFGISNSGKSTFINLLIRQLNSSLNQINIGGHDICEFSKKNIAEIFSYCPQNIQLFADTIKNNLLIANNDANEQSLDNVLCDVNLNRFIGDNKLIHIGEHGKKLSGGQQQRLMIARTLLSNSKIQIFDDCFSGLDRITQNQIINKIIESNKSVIISSQKPNILEKCDLIYVFKEGKIISFGKHEELLEKCNYYYDSYMERALD